MRSDLELLELAAQAIGEQFHSGHITQNGKQYEWVEWNPLTDDGDALRLAAKLNLDIRYSYLDDGVAVIVGGAWDGSPEGVHEIFEHAAALATRRAIVRGAAEIAAQHPRTDGGGRE